MVTQRDQSHTLQHYLHREEKVEMLKKVSNKGTMQKWLDKRFRHEKTKKGYKVALTRFVKAVYGEDIIPSKRGLEKVGEIVDIYLSEKRNFLDDLSKYLLWMSKKHAPRTVVSDVFMVRKFFSRHNHKISDEEWDDLQPLLRPNVAITQDDILNKEQLRAIMNHLYITGRALTLFLISTGARIGETLQLKLEDLKLDADPPSANIRPEYTKGGVGKRVVWMSYEARDAIKEWMKVKESMKKRHVGGSYRRDIVFPFKYLNFRVMWVKALEKTKLDKKDSKTGIQFFHIHTLRKFFSTNMKQVGDVHPDIVHAWMGHKGYLPMYDKFGKKKMAEIYKNHMAAVSIYVSDEEMKQSQLIIIEDELSTYLQSGWTFKATLPSGQIVVEGTPGQIMHRKLEQVKRVKESTPQPVKSEVSTPTKTRQSSTVSMKPSHEESTPQPIETKPVAILVPKEKHVETSRLVPCPYIDNWVHPVKCDQCKVTRFNVWKDCQERRRRNPNDPLFKISKPKPSF